MTYSGRFKEWGFEKGWGDTADQVKETMRTLSEVLQAPDPLYMEKFFSRIPMILSIVIFSPHGYFGQSDVLGLPDTGGQVWKFPDVKYIRSCFDEKKQITCFHDSVSGGLHIGSSEGSGRRTASQE